VPVIDMLARIAEDGNFMTADAFRRTMQAQSDATGFVRSDIKPEKRRKTLAPQPDTGEQLNLLAV